MDSFGTLLGKLLQERGISASELSKQLGLRSKTTLLRILQDQSAYPSVSRFWTHLCESNLIEFTTEERSSLEDALQMLFLGREEYRVRNAMRSLLENQERRFEPVFLHGLPPYHTFAELTASYASAQDLEITIIGMCDLRIFEALHQLISLMPPDRQPLIRHYMFNFAEVSDAIISLQAVFPILFNRNYQPSLIVIDGHLSEHHFPGEMMLCRFRDSDGQLQHHQLCLSCASEMQAVAYPDGTAYDFWQRMTLSSNETILPLKARFSQEHSPDDYLAYMESIRLLELNTNQYILKPDIAISLVPAKILCQAVLDNLSTSGFLPDDQAMALLQAMADSHDKRHRHLFERHRVTHMIFSQQAMLQFARTGRQSDHFFGARPYTPQERCEILQNCLDQSLSNPYFNVYFSSHEALMHSAEICHYEGKGTVLVKGKTNYRLTHDHAEAQIIHEGFNRHFRQYYIKELLTDFVLPVSEGHAFLRSLIEIARTSE